MTSTYARITDDTLARKAREFWENQPETTTDSDSGVERLRARFTTALPNGFCTLPSAQRCEFRPNPCLDCSFHDPGGRVFLGSHIVHRDQLQRLADAARERGDTEAVEVNATVLDKAIKLIGELDPDSQEGR